MRTRRYRKRGGASLMDFWNGLTAKATELTEQTKAKATELKNDGVNQLTQATTGISNSLDSLSQEPNKLYNAPPAGGRRRKSRRKRTRRR